MRCYLGVILAIVLFANLRADEEVTTTKEFKGRSFIYYMKKLLEFDEPTRYRVEGVPFSMTWSNSQSSDRHILVGCVLNAKELGCLPTIVDLFSDFHEGKLGSYQGRITFFIANPHTAVALGSADPNLAFANNSDATELEKSRAAELKKLFTEDVDLFIELTQRVSPTGINSYSFPYDELTYEWALALETTDTLIVPPVYNPKKEMSMAEYARSKDILSLGLDLVIKDKSEAELQKAYGLSRRSIERALSLRSRVGKMRDIFDYSKDSPKLKNFYRSIYLEPFEKPDTKLVEGLADFKEIKQGEVVGESSEMPLKAPVAGYLLRPKYPKRDEKGQAKEPLPRNLYEIIEKVKFEELTD